MMRSSSPQFWSNGLAHHPDHYTGVTSAEQRVMMRTHEHLNYASRKHLWVNCWYRSQHESAAMWRLYSQGQGIALVSSYKRMCESFGGDDEIHIGRVRYVDFETASFPEGNVLYRFMHKQLSFEHESEVRALIVRFPIDEETHSLDFDMPSPIGLHVPVAVDGLVSELRVSPLAPAWFTEVVEDVTRRYGFTFPVNPSTLDHAPVY